MLNVSIVIYKQCLSEISPLVQELRKSALVSDIFLIDNSPEIHPEFKTLSALYHFTGKNIGYGAAHNIAIRETILQKKPYHLVVNPDILFQKEILDTIITYLNKNTDIGQLMPKVFYPDGKIQYLCKLIPTPFDLFIRRFLPENWTKKGEIDLRCVQVVTIK